MIKNNTVPGEDADHIRLLIEAINKNGDTLSNKKVTAGFDGFVDTIVKLIKNKTGKKPPVYFSTKKSFGNYIIEKEGTSFSLELEEKNIKLGGNMPIMSNALGCMGIPVNCIGALGYPQQHPVFKYLSPKCKLYSFAEPGTSTAVEFKDGKILLGLMGKLNSSGWQIVKERIGIKTLINLYKESDLLCLVNWAEIDASAEIWQGLLKDVFKAIDMPADKLLSFFDLADFSKKSNRSIKEVISLLKEFTLYTKVILGLNRNEAKLIYKVLYNKPPGNDLGQLGQHIFKKLSIQTLVLHSSKESVALDKTGTFTSKSFFIKAPVISTGAGDNFNAGFCAGQLMQLGLQPSIIFANAVAGIYMQTGTSPALKDVVNFLKTR